NLRSAAVLGERRTRRDQCGRAENRRDLAPGGHHGISGGGLSSAGDLGPTRLPQPDLLPRGRQGRALRGLGTAGALRCGDPGGVQVTAASGPESIGALTDSERRIPMKTRSAALALALIACAEGKPT